MRYKIIMNFVDFVLNYNRPAVYVIQNNNAMNILRIHIFVSNYLKKVANAIQNQNTMNACFCVCDKFVFVQ